MCKGKPAGAVVATFRAGDTINVRFDGTARHGGVQSESRYSLLFRGSVNLPCHMTMTGALL